MSAFLEVPFDRLRIVGIVESSRRMLEANAKYSSTLTMILKSSNGIGKASEGYSAE